MARRKVKRRIPPKLGSTAHGRATASRRANSAPWIVGAILAAVAGILGWRLLAPSGGAEPVVVVVPSFSSEAQLGAQSYDVNCARCHGVNAAGTDRGPPLVHVLYTSGHHADMAFVLAARVGVSQHHWSFGKMPPQPELADAEIASITRYVRELQKANGID